MSDLHITEANRTSVEVVLDALWADLQWWRSNGVKPDIVCFSGDIAQSGKPAEYSLAEQILFVPLLDHLGLPKNRLFWVPGNHDVDRAIVTRDRLIEAGLRATLKQRDDFNGVLQSDYEREMALRRLAPYGDFTRSFFGDTLGGQNPEYFVSRQVEVNGTSLGVACLNSAWRCSSTDVRQLAIGEHQLRQARRALNESDVRIALVHHPFDWLLEDEEWRTEEFCMREFHLLLCGHLHSPRVRQIRTPQGLLAYLPAGSLFQGRHPDRLEGYSLIDLTAPSASAEWQVTVHLRRYVPESRFDRDLQSAPPDGSFALSLSTRDPLTVVLPAKPLSTLPKEPA